MGTRDAVDEDRAKRLVATHHRLNGASGHVLAVDPQPIPRAPCEVEVPSGVSVTEVSRPVPAVADPVGFGVGTFVVPLEADRSRSVHDLTDRRFGVHQLAVGVERSWRALLERLVDDDHVHPRWCRPEGTERGIGRGDDVDTTFGRSVALDQADAEALGEGQAIRERRLGAETHLEAVVAIFRARTRGEQVGNGLAHVGELGRSGATDVVQPLRRRELRCRSNGATRPQRRCPQRHDGVAVEERHGAVPNVIAGEAVVGAGGLGNGGEAPLRATHRFGCSGGSRREEQEVEVARRNALRLGQHCVDVVGVDVVEEVAVGGVVDGDAAT